MHNDSSFWIQKLAAFLHDPPSKALDIAEHWKIARSAYVQAEIPEEHIQKYEKAADHTAAAADRLPFPSSRASGLKCRFDGMQNTFRHPLSGEPLRLEPFKTANLAEEVTQTVQPVLSDFGDLPEPEKWRARYFAHWRLWKTRASAKDRRLAFLPADTRIPDHTIWNHMGMVSALASCTETTANGTILRPAFLKFQLGPVQDFIAAAKSVRDLWSGSYLLSWLMAAGMKALSAEIGPDAVVFPNLHGQPLFDLHWRDELWSKVSIGDTSIWDSFGYDDRDGHRDHLLVPNLPNVFLAIVPEQQADRLGKLVANAIQNEWESIARACWERCEKEGLTEDVLEPRFERQVNRFLQISWAAEPWPNTLNEALKLAAAGFPEGMPIRQAASAVEGVTEMATTQMPVSHRDSRYYTDNTSEAKLNNIGVAWSILVQHASWKLDAVRQTRAFEAWHSGGWSATSSNEKDALTGREETVAGGDAWHSRCEHVLKGEWLTLFKKPAPVGAITLVKRVWHLAYLNQKWALRTQHGREFPMPNTHGIAAGTPFADTTEDADDVPENDKKHFAILALDGDQIGRWVSGENTPTFERILADYRDEHGERRGAVAYFEQKEFKAPQPGAKDFLQKRRPLSPGFHLQFSESLSNFALHCARRVVEKWDGRLIYAGGDDVLAMLPANQALECAQALRDAFQGRSVERADLTQVNPGFLSDGSRDERNELIPFTVPGEAADCSVGIAIAHFKAPLQDVVRAAQTAEKRAKNQLHRAAVAISIFKRSGEITEWGCQWQSGGIVLYNAIATRLDSGALSAKFPHRVCQLLEPYRNSRSGLSKQSADIPVETVISLIEKEFAFSIRRQSEQGKAEENERELGPILSTYLRKIAAPQPSKTGTLAPTAQTLLAAVIGLCTTVAFAHRTSPEPPAPKGN